MSHKNRIEGAQEYFNGDEITYHTTSTNPLEDPHNNSCPPQYIKISNGSIQNNIIDPNKSKIGKIPVAESLWALDHIARVSEQSKLKGYEPMNWIRTEIKCYFVKYLCSAAIRHLDKFIAGEDYNTEVRLDGSEVKTEFDVLHLENAAYNLLMAAHLFRLNRTDLDDRI